MPRVYPPSHTSNQSRGPVHLSAKAIKSAALTLQRIHDVQAGDSFALGVLSVSHCIANDAFKEGLENTAGFFINHCGWKSVTYSEW